MNTDQPREKNSTTSRRQRSTGRGGNNGGTRTQSNAEIGGLIGQAGTGAREPCRDSLEKRNKNKRNTNQNGSGKSQEQQDMQQNPSSSSSKTTNNIVYPKYWTLEECLTRYNANDPALIRGVLRVLPAKNAIAFCRCDRGSQAKDVVLDGPLERNRALDGDTVFVELRPETEEEKKEEREDKAEKETNEFEEPKPDVRAVSEAAGRDIIREEWWQDDPDQIRLWNPTVPLIRNKSISQEFALADEAICSRKQRHGRVVYVVYPKQSPNEIHPTERSQRNPVRRIVGRLKRLKSGTTLLTPSNKSLEQFRLHNSIANKYKEASEDAIFQAKYVYGSWKEDCKWPPCTELEPLGHSGNIEDETTALLIENGVDHGEFLPSVLEESQKVVALGQYTQGTESGWKPTAEMYKGRRDYRKQCIFTIDPTTARDLDDALHVTDLGNGQVEIGVHIADVSYFVQPDSEIDKEAQRRCTTVYLVDRTIPMLPRPLCEVACSLNENVERLAFSCVWRMHKDGTLVKDQNIWYGRTVIKSCARLDYATAQNIIESKVAYGKNDIDPVLWPVSRRPTGGHTIDQVASDVRLMNEIAQARRRIRFKNGAIALDAVKLTFKLDDDGETPQMCEPYPIRDSNRLVEEYMLLANYLVAQRLITHADGRALLRHHEPPLYDGLEETAALAMEAGCRIDTSSSEALQRSLNRLTREVQDGITLKCITELMKKPMRPANYIAAGEIEQSKWAHFALHIPYYTHFTSPIRRYADIIVHRLLQATLDGTEAVEDFHMDVKQIGLICGQCNAKKDGSRQAQERSDVVFLALYLRRYPMKHQLGVVLSVGVKAFTVFLPSLGQSGLIYLEEHQNWIQYEAYEAPNAGNRIKLKRIQRHNGEQWQDFVVKTFAKVRVTCLCTDKPPLNVKLQFEGPWKD